MTRIYVHGHTRRTRNGHTNVRPHYRTTKKFKQEKKAVKLSRESGTNEWIADLDLKGSNLVIRDVQHGTHTTSYMLFDKTDEKENVGYIHYHPPGVYPHFSTNDYLLTTKVHNLRKNKDKMQYTLMGLVTPATGGKYHIRIYALKPTPSTTKALEKIQKLPPNQRIRALRRYERKLFKTGELKVYKDEYVRKR